MDDRYLSLAAMDKLFRETSSLRVADNARLSLRDILERQAKEIGRLAWRFARHAKRSTVREEDIRLAIEQLR